MQVFYTSLTKYNFMIIIFTVLWLVFFDIDKKENIRYRIKTLRYDTKKKTYIIYNSFPNAERRSSLE